ncbi:peroxidase manganese-dependent 1 [Diaporthe helianthi]|uniref:Peroxidase n=1 Tax=Diaporthe helianthi TaxID=158607 RepID=A0A2P5HVH6_DIAHE|nr:peroxidase manganese-dependent 1 [Diaporthe helianthi]
MHSLLPIILASSVVSAKPYHKHASRELFADLRNTPILATRSTSLMGDLVGESTSTLSAAGAEISSILTGMMDALADGDGPSYTAPGDIDSAECAADTCCKWRHIMDDIRGSFTDGDGCTATARGAIRLGFHDAAAWELSLASGGADGSVVLNKEELARVENRGLQDIAAQTQTWFDQYEDLNISMADLIQMNAIAATAACPGGPRIKAYVGRVDSDELPPAGLIPSPFADAQTNIALFEAKTFTAGDLVALVGAHTVSQQQFVDPSQAGKSQDTTDGTWDSTYYGETASPDTPDGVFKFQSDISLSNDSETSGTWQAFARDQRAWEAAYAPAYFRMSLLGVRNLNELTDCSIVI